MKCLNIWMWCMMLALQSCFSLPSVAVHAGFAGMALDGNVGFAPASSDREGRSTRSVDGGSAGSVKQGIDDALGLGDLQGTPYLRAEVDLGMPRLSISGLRFRDSGSGVLDQQFGSNLPAATPVSSDFDLTNIKAALTFDLGFGPVTLSPGIALSYLDLKVGAEDVLGVFREELDLTAPVPLPMIRGEVDLSVASLIAEIGYIDIDYDSVRAKMLDLEVLLEIRPTRILNIFVGYRSLQIEAAGRIKDDQVDVNVGLSGFIVGGGLRF
jgi:hypothetical protein